MAGRTSNGTATSRINQANRTGGRGLTGGNLLKWRMSIRVAEGKASVTAAARLMLIEFFPGALRRNERSLLFPFLKGLAGERGLKTLWLCYGGAVGHWDGARGGRAPVASLTEEDLRSLSRRWERFHPTHVVSSHALGRGAAEFFASRTPPPKLIVMPLPGALPPEAAHSGKDGDPGHCGWFLDWLGAPDPASARRYLVERAVPDYSAVLANKAARTANPHITIAGGVLCANRRTVAENPYFAGVDLSGIGHRGCSFCTSATKPSLTSPGTDILPVIETQFRKILATPNGTGRNKNRYEFFDIHAFWKFEEVFRLILRLKVPPAVFLFNPRIDDVLRLRPRIERMLPALAKAGHEVRMLSMGAENFSERENARFNKGISLEQVDEFLALMKNWGKDYPGVFRPFKAGNDAVELGFILFTPWTTLEDIRLNLTLAASRGFPARGYWLYSTLLIKSATPIDRLAVKEGDILADRFPDPGQAYGLHKNEGETGDVHPWRFRDSKVADYFAMLVRVCAADRDGPGCSYFQGDPDFALAAGLYRSANARGGVAPLKIALSLLGLMEAAHPPYSRAALLYEAVERASAGAEAPPESRPGPPPSAGAGAVQRVLDRLRRAKPAPFSGVEFRPVREIAEGGSRFLRLTLAAGGRELTFDLLEPRSDQPYYIRSRRFLAVYPKDAPPPSPRERELLTLLLGLFDAAL